MLFYLMRHVVNFKRDDIYFLQEKRRARKTSEDETLDEEFLNKTYNPKKQDKYTLFTPHALDSIEEESTSMLSMSITL